MILMIFEIKKNRGHGGFTIIEVLVAIFLLSYVMIAIYSTFNAVVGKTEAIESGSEIFNMAKTCLNRMSDDLLSIYVSQKPAYQKPEFGDEPDLYRIVSEQTFLDDHTFSKLKFSSLSHIPFSTSKRTSGIAEIVYYVGISDFGEYVLRRYDALYPHEPFEENGKEPIICEKIKSLKFKFFDEEGEEYEIWDSESEDTDYATPTSIGIRLELGDHDSTYLFSTNVKLPVCRKKL